MSFGVWISMKSRAANASRNSAPTALCSRKMALLAGVRRSSTRLSRRVSSSTRGKGDASASASASGRAASSKSNGIAAAARDTQRMEVTASSTAQVAPVMGTSGCTSTPSKSTTLSLVKAHAYFTMPLLTVLSSTNITTWTMRRCVTAQRRARRMRRYGRNAPGACWWLGAR